jgi:hypothetical protein
MNLRGNVYTTADWVSGIFVLTLSIVLLMLCFRKHIFRILMVILNKIKCNLVFIIYRPKILEVIKSNIDKSKLERVEKETELIRKSKRYLKSLLSIELSLGPVERIVVDKWREGIRSKEAHLKYLLTIESPGPIEISLIDELKKDIDSREDLDSGVSIEEERKIIEDIERKLPYLEDFGRALIQIIKKYHFNDKCIGLIDIYERHRAEQISSHLLAKMNPSRTISDFTFRSSSPSSSSSSPMTKN